MPHNLAALASNLPQDQIFDPVDDRRLSTLKQVSISNNTHLTRN